MISLSVNQWEHNPTNSALTPSKNEIFWTKKLIAEMQRAHKLFVDTKGSKSSLDEKQCPMKKTKN